MGSTDNKCYWNAAVYLERDIENFNQYRLGFSQRLLLAKGVLPSKQLKVSKFHCQQNHTKRLSRRSTYRAAYIKRQRNILIQECEEAAQSNWRSLISKDTIAISSFNERTEQEPELKTTMALIVDNDLEDASPTLEFPNNIKEEPEVTFDEDGSDSYVSEDEEAISEWSNNIKEEPELTLDEDEDDDNVLDDAESVSEGTINIKREPQLPVGEDEAEHNVLQDPLAVSWFNDCKEEDPELHVGWDESESNNCVDALLEAILEAEDEDCPPPLLLPDKEPCLKLPWETSDPEFSLEGDETESIGGVVRWCMQRGLIAKERTCGKCSGPMKLNQRSDGCDRVHWSCQGPNKSHVCRCSIRQKSWFAGSHMKMGDILKLTYLWVKECSHASICEELKLSGHTVVDWRRYCREVCVKDCLTNGDILGGEGSVVEIIEANLTRRKFGRCEPLNGTWVFGGVERGSNKSFFEVAPETTKCVFLNVLKKYVLPGTTVISDCFQLFDCLSDREFIQLSAEHKITFKVPVKRKTNTAEGMWTSIFPCVRGRKKRKGSCDSHLFEYMWRRRWSGERDLFIAFLEAVRRVYNPE